MMILASFILESLWTTYGPKTFLIYSKETIGQTILFKSLKCHATVLTEGNIRRLAKNYMPNSNA